MLFFFVQLVVVLFLCFAADAFHNDKAPSFLEEVVRRGDGESCRCSDIVPLLNKLITEFENTAGSVREIQSQTQQTAKDLKLHEDHLKLLDNRTCRHDQPPTKPTTGKVCPSGFEYLSEVNDCVKIFFQPMNWDRAGEVCRQVMPGVRLATITSAAKQQAIERYLQKQFTGRGSDTCLIPMHLWDAGIQAVWTSGQTPNPRRCGGTYLWKSPGTIDVPLTYTNWDRGEPTCSKRNGQEETCLHLMVNRNYKWNDLFCDWAVCALCEF